MRQTLRLLAIGLWSLFSAETLVAILDWWARWDWLKQFFIDHPHFAKLIRTPFSYVLLAALAYLCLRAERNLKQPKIVARYANSRVVPDLHSATMQMLFDTEKKNPGWDEHRFDWDWFIEVQMTNDSETPATIDSLEVRVRVGKKWRKRKIEVQHCEDLNSFDMDMGRDNQGHPHGRAFVGKRYRPVPSLMEKIRDIPLEQEIGYRGWLHLKVKQVNQREMNSGKISIDIWLIDAMQRKHKLYFKKKSEKNWNNDFFIFPK